VVAVSPGAIRTGLGGVFDPDGYSLEFVYKSWQHA